jgi:DNA-binding XRE family transcriptional regulator
LHGAADRFISTDLVDFIHKVRIVPQRLTPEQCRAARALLDWTQEELADHAEISKSTVRDFEKGRHGLQRASAAQIILAFGRAGVMMIPPDEHGPGVRFRDREF